MLLAGAIWLLVPDQVPGYTLAAYSDMTSPAFFPISVAALLLLISLVIAVRALLSMRRGGEEEPLESVQTGRVVCAAAVMVAFVVLMPLIGTVVAMAMLVAGLMLAFGARRPRVLMITAILTPIVIVSVFERLLLILFPHGVLY